MQRVFLRLVRLLEQTICAGERFPRYWPSKRYNNSSYSDKRGGKKQKGKKEESDAMLDLKSVHLLPPNH